MSLAQGIATWLVEGTVIAALAGGRRGARVALALSLPFMLLPLYVNAPPLARALLGVAGVMCVLRAVDFATSSVSLAFGQRWLHMFVLVDVRRVRPRPRGLNLRSTLAAILGLALFVVVLLFVRDPALRGHGVVRWLALVVGLCAVFEAADALIRAAAAPFGIHTPLLSDAPYRSRTLAEFWGRRWNGVISGILRERCFDPLARRSTIVALVAAFLVSGALHGYLTLVSLTPALALPAMAFFLVQPPLIVAERKLKVRRWPPIAARAWTIGLLLLTSPLLLVPMLYLLAPDATITTAAR